MTKARKPYTFSSTCVFMRGCVFVLFVAALLTALPCSVKAEMVLFWNFDEYTTEGGVNYVIDSVHSERLKLVNASIVDGQLTANGGYAQGTGTNNGTTTALPLGSSTTPNYTLSAFLTSTTNATVGIMGWGAKSGGKCNCFRTTGNSGETTGGLNSYWWGSDVVVSGGYPEIYGGVENHVATTAVGNTHYLYLNGQLLLSDTKGARSEANQDFAVGKTVNNEQLKGSLDNASIYNEALEQSDIIRISTSKLNGLTNWWKSGTTVDRISGVVKPETVTGTTVITGANGDVLVFNRALEVGEQAFYQGQLVAGHDYVIDNMADSASTKTTWLRASSANLSAAAQTPLGIYVGGTTTASTLTATADQLNSVNRTFVLGGGTLAIASDSDVSVEKNRVGFDSGSISTSGTGTTTLNSSEKISLKNVNLGTNSKLAFNSSDDMRVIGAVNLDANSAFTINTTGSVQTAGTVTLGANSAATFNAGDIVRAAGAITLNSGSAFTINTSGDIQTTGAINLGENSALTFNTPGSVRPTGAFAGKGDLVKSGTGNLFLTVKSTNHEGTLHVNGGTVTFSIQDVFGTADDFPKNSIVVDNAIVTNNAAVFNNLKDATFKNGAKIVAANGNRDWKAFMLTGTTNIAFSGDGTTAEAPVVFEVASSATGDARTNATICPFGNTFNVADITKSADPDLIITAVLANTNGTGKIGSFTKTGAGTLKLAAANTFNGDIDIQGGTVVMAYNCNGTSTTATPLGNPSLTGRKITIHSGATLETESSTAGIDVFGGAEAHPKFTIVVDGGKIVTATNQLTSYGNIELKNGGVFEERGGHDTWFTIFNGDISVTSGNATIQSSSSGRGISLRGYRDGVNAGVTFDVAENSTLTVSALLRDCKNRNVASSFTKKGEGTMILSNNSNDYTGNIVVDEGILKATTGWRSLGSGKYSTVFGYYQAKTVTVNANGELVLAAQDVVSNSTHSSPIQFIANGGKISNSGTVYNNLNNTVLKNGGQIYASDGNGTWKAYKLSTKVSVLRDTPSAQPAKISSDLSKANATISFGNTTSLYIEDVTSATTDLDTKSDLIISAVITNPNTESNGTFYKDGTGILEFTAANTYNGTTSIRAGVLRLSGAGSMGTSAVNLVTNGSAHGTLEFKDSTATIPSAISGEGDLLVSSGTANLTGVIDQTGGSTILADGTTLNIGSDTVAVNPTLNNLAVSFTDENSSATLTVYGDLTLNNDQMSKFIGSIKADTITKTGDETLKIYTGASGQVDAQSLVVSSGHLDLKGYMKGNITVDANTVFSPGNSVGEATYGGNYILNEGATLLMEIGGQGVDENDSLYNKDNLADAGKLIIDGLIILTLADDSTLKGGDTFTAILSGSNSGDDGFGDDLLSHVQSYYFTDLQYVPLGDGNYAITGTLDPNAVPEPSTWALILLGVSGLLLWRKRVRN